MKTYIVDIPSGLTDATNVLAALKVFALKNKNLELLCCGASADFSILEDNANISVDYVEGSESSSERALSHLEQENMVGFLSFAKRSDLLEAAHKVLKKEVSPCYGLIFHGVDPEKEALLIDAGGFGEETEENIEAYLSYAMDYLTNILRKPKDDIPVGYLAFKEALSPANRAIDAFLRKQEINYRGLVGAGDLLDSCCAIVLSAGPIAPSCLASANAGKQVHVTRQIVQSGGNLFAKWSGSKPAEIEDFDHNGYLLFGYGFHLYSLSQKAHYQDVMTALSNLERYERNQPRK
jgi:hypothetical protein